MAKELDNQKVEKMKSFMKMKEEHEKEYGIFTPGQAGRATIKSSTKDKENMKILIDKQLLQDKVKEGFAEMEMAEK